MKNLLNRIIFKLIIFIIKNNLDSHFLRNFLFKDNLKNLLILTGLSPYFAKFKEKIILLQKIKIFQHDKNLFFNIPVNTDDQKILDTLNDKGITSKLSLFIPKNEILFVNKYFEQKDYYDSHMPLVSKRRKVNLDPEGAYMSYDFNTQLNCLPILKLCLNERVISIAEKYLGTVPILYSINTFRTLPKKLAFTHGFHRDVENIKMLVFFIFWTDTNKDDGAFEQIYYTHKPSQKLSHILENNNLNLLPKDENNFFKLTTSYGHDEKYFKIFQKEKIFSSYGKSGHIATADTFGIHRGTSVKTPRLVTWIRFGVTQERGISVKSSELENNINLEGECSKFYRKNKYRSVLDKLLNEK